MQNHKYIFSFWEPKSSIPAYLRLCMKTWEKFLPDYEIIILDYSNIDNWLGGNFYPKCLYSDFSLPIQADAIRAAILNKFGGIWLDIDTIITSENIKNILNINSQFVLINKHVAFIKADKNSKILNKWLKGIQKSLKIYEIYKNDKTPKLIKFLINKRYHRKFNAWNFLGNKILNKFLKTKKKNIFYKIDGFETKALPEINFAHEQKSNLTNSENYEIFYFKNNYSKYALDGNCGIILLHNSWTPQEFKNMSDDEFLSNENTLSEIFKNVLEINLCKN